MSNELICLKPEQFPALDPNNDRLAIIQENLDGQPLSAADLNRIRLPKGDLDKMPNTPEWMLETSDGETELESFRAVVIYTKCRRAYYKNPKPVDGTPPDCSSSDCVNGVGNPGGECASCPFKQWNSAQGGTGAGQACRMSRVFLFVREGEFLPEWFSAPPTSLKDMQKYLFKLGVDGLAPISVITEFSLKKGKSSVIVVAKKVGVLDKISYDKIVKIKNDFSGAAESLNRDHSNAEEEPQYV